MKIFTVLYSFYILVLALVPCSDELSALSSAELTCSHKVNEIHKHTHGNYGDEDDRDCSPFCVCSCCGIFINTVNASPALLLTAEIETSQEKIFFYNNTYIYVPHVDIWHPPV